jgi:hypothetical protein
MSTLLATLAEEKATMRWREPYLSDGLNRKFHGPVPHGVVRGGNLVTSLSALTVEVAPDAETGDSVYTYHTSDGRQLTVREIGTISLSLNTGGVPDSTVYIGLAVDYAIGSDTEAQWRAYSQAEIDADDSIVVVGKVVVPGSGVIPAENVTLDRRRDAWQNKSVGMRDWRQIVKSGNVDLPVPGKAADRLFPYLLAKTTGSMTIEHSDIYKRSMTHSIRFEGPSGSAVLGSGAGDGVYPTFFPVRENQRVLYSFYVRADNWTYSGAQNIGFAFLDELSTGAGAAEVTRDFTNSGTDADWVHVTGVVKAPYDGWMTWAIVSNVAANAGYLYFDDIRIWIETGNALEDEGQSYIMGINRQIEGSTLALVPTFLQDSLENWANSTIRLINTSPADGSAVSAKMTVDPLNDIDLFDLDIRAAVTIPGGLTVDVSWLPGDVRAIDAKASGWQTAIRGRGDDSVTGISQGILGMGGDDSTFSIGVEGVGGDDAVSYSFGMYGWSYSKYGLGGLFGAGEAGVGAIGLGDASMILPDFSENQFIQIGLFGIGGYDYVIPAAYDFGHGSGAGVVGFGGQWEAGPGRGVVGFGAEGDEVFAGAEGGYFKGGDGAYPRAGVRGVGSDGLGMSLPEGGAGGRFYGGEGYFAGYGVYGRGGTSGIWSVGAVGVGDEAGGAFECTNAAAFYEALLLNSGILFYEGNSDSESQNPAATRSIRNVLKAANVVKVWAWVYCNNDSSPSLTSGFNVSSLEWAGGSDQYVIVNFGQDFDHVDNFSVVVTPETLIGGVGPYLAVVMFRSKGLVQIAVYEVGVGWVTLKDSGLKLNVIAIGHQDLQSYPL